LVIQKTAAGKPFLRDSLSIRFNLTHSHDRALVAVAQTRDVGIDLEKVRPEVDVVSLAKRFLSSRDQTLIERGEPTRQHERFLQTWVAREAVYKAQGTGLTFPLNQDHVELTEDGTAGCLVQGSSNSNGESRPIRFLSLEPGWVGAVSAKGTDWTVSYRE
jgi:4'-phosphopantetheinyl transferase